MPGQCPNCKAEQPEGAAECPQCGIVYAKFLKRQAAKSLESMAQAETAAAAPAPSPASAGDKGGAGVIIAAAAVVAAACAGGLLLYPGKGKPVTDSLQQNKDQAFAAAAPAGFKANWTEGSPNDEGWHTAGSITGTYAEGFAPQMGILSLPVPAVKVNRGLKDQLAEKYFRDIRSSVDKWSPDSVRVVKVDGLASLRVEGGGAKHVKRVIPAVVMNTKAAMDYVKQKNPSAFSFLCRQPIEIDRIGPPREVCIMEDARTEEADYELVSGGVLVPGRQRSYLLTYLCDRDQKAACLTAFDEFVDSFRVLERPRPLDFLQGGG